MRRKILIVLVSSLMLLFGEVTLSAETTSSDTTIGVMTSEGVPTVPAAPILLAATTISTSSIRIYWQNISPIQVKTQITRSALTAAGKKTTDLPTLEANTTSYTDDNLPPGSYTYSLYACSKIVCSAPTNTKAIVISSVIPTTSTVSTSPTGTVTTTASSPVSTNSVTTTAVIPTPSIPKPLSATQANGIVTLTWADTSTNESRFEVYRSLSGGTPTTIAAKEANYTSYTDKSAPPGTYIYSIAACNSSGCSIRAYFSSLVVISEGISTTPASPTPNIPTTTTVVATTTSGTTGTTSTVSATSLTSTTPAIPTVDTKKTPSTTTVIKEDTTSKKTTEHTKDKKEKESKEISKAIGTTAVGSYVNIVPVTTSAATTSYTTTTSHDGSFTAEVPDGTYLVESFSSKNTEGSKVETSQITVTDGKVIDVKEVLKTASKKLYGKVSFANGDPINDAEIDAYKKETGQWISTTTNNYGQFFMELQSGVWAVRITPKDTSLATWILDNQDQSFSFSTENIDEVKQTNFVVTPRNSSLTILVQNEDGTPLPNIGVIVDTVSAKDSTDNNDRQLQTKKTGEDGKVNLLYPMGSYFIRTSVPEKMPYVASNEQQVTLTSSGNKTISLTLQKETSSNTTKVTGTTKFSDGTATDGFVWAWSDQGGHDQMRTGVDGIFNFNLTNNQSWHIGASKDTKDKSYKSSDFVINTNATPSPIDLIFIKTDATVLPPTTTVKKDSTEQVTVLSDDGAQFSLPKNSVTTNNQINVEVKPTTEAPSHSASEVVSTVYDITIKDTAGQKFTKLKEEAEIKIPYDEAELKAKHITPEDLIPSFYDETIATWVPVTKYTINREKHVVILHVDHLTRYALIAAADVTPPESPTKILTDAFAPQEIKISWDNPQKDFDHAKIYRSEVLGKVGVIIAAEVQTNSFVDKAYIINGKTYYYTIRAVDSAGNESNNTDQVIFTTKKSSQLADKKTTSSLLLPPGQTLSSGGLTRILDVGSKGEDVTALQTFLKKSGLYGTSTPITGYYGPLTKNAVKRFQSKYAKEILIPNGFKSPTGMVGNATRKKINELLVSETLP